MNTTYIYAALVAAVIGFLTSIISIFINKIYNSIDDENIKKIIKILKYYFFIVIILLCAISFICVLILASN